VTNLKNMEMTLTNQNIMQKEIRRRLNSENDSHYSIYKYNDLSTKTIMFPIAFMGIKHGLSH
jgi:hypothetical protein